MMELLNVNRNCRWMRCLEGGTSTILQARCLDGWCRCGLRQAVGGCLNSCTSQASAYLPSIQSYVEYRVCGRRITILGGVHAAASLILCLPHGASPPVRPALLACMPTSLLMPHLYRILIGAGLLALLPVNGAQGSLARQIAVRGAGVAL